MDTISKNLIQGVKEASDKLYSFSQNHITLDSNRIQLIPITEVSSLFGEEEQVVYGVVMTLLEQPPIQYVMIMTKKSREKIVESIYGKDALEQDELADSILQELGNILGSSIANRLSRYIKRPIMTSTPHVLSDLLGAIFNSIISEREYVDDNLVFIDIALKVDNIPIKCTSFLLFDEDITNKLLSEVAESS